MNLLRNGHLKLWRWEVRWSVIKVAAQTKKILNTRVFERGGVSYKLHIGPGPEWKKLDETWVTLDVDPTRGDVVINLNDFEKLPFDNESVVCIYGSHIFEHVNMWSSLRLFKECYRILVPCGYFRLVLPDVHRSIEEYMRGNSRYLLFQRRKKRAKQSWGLDDYTLFECLREDFISGTGQTHLLSSHGLAHQNAWDFETIVRDLCRAGFRAEDVSRMAFQTTNCSDFEFEGSYPSEANEEYRSLYVEARKT